MRTIEVTTGLRLRFPQRSAEFDEGVEIGIAAMRMASGEASIEQWLSRDAIGQFRAIAQKFDYRVVVEESAEHLQRAVAFRPSRAPRLRIV